MLPVPLFFHFPPPFHPLSVNLISNVCSTLKCVSYVHTHTHSLSHTHTHTNKHTRTHTHTQKGFSKPSRPVSSKERGTVTSNRCMHERYIYIYLILYTYICICTYIYIISEASRTQQRSPNSTIFQT